MRITLEYSVKQEQIFHNWKEGVKYKIIPKGRRSGFTKGAANAVIDWMLQKETQILWGDTISGNVQRYFERYFEPELKRNGITYHWDKVYHQLKIGKSFCDFRSADRPENWEGFGYKYILLNEAGIILKNRDLYVKTVLPMLIDFPDSKLIAGGVPKGKKTKTGDDHMFYELSQRTGKEYEHIRITAYDNPWLTPSDIAQLEKEMMIIGGQSMADQEVYGLFIDKISDNPFFTPFDRAKHVKPCKLDKSKGLYISLDFNLNPFAMTAGHVWRDSLGHHVRLCETTAIKNGSIPELIRVINEKYSHWLPGLKITGDYSGHKREQALADNASHYMQIQRGLRLRDSQIITPVNPSHKNSRADCNYTLYYHPDIQIDPSCEELIFDMENVEYDSVKEQIIKAQRNDAAQKADFCDNFRYFEHAFIFDWRVQHERVKK